MPSLKINAITLDAFNSTLSRYESIVPENLRELDTIRYETIPFKIRSRKNSTASLAKEHVKQLVEWKLKHGTFRPQLLQLVQSNGPDFVRETTRDAFSSIVRYHKVELSDNEGENDIVGDANKSLKILTALKGVGPATASLIMSVAAPERIPFFSDELFRWTMFDELGSPAGWKRAIKYTAKEYNELITRVNALVQRLGVRALDAEKVAYVLGKEGADLEGDDGDEDAKQSQTKKPADAGRSNEARSKAESSSTVGPKKGTKRKETASKLETEGTRKSTRTKR